MNKIEHIGIAVKNLDDAIKTYTELLGTECYKTEAVESEGVKISDNQIIDFEKVFWDPNLIDKKLAK